MIERALNEKRVYEDSLTEYVSALKSRSNPDKLKELSEMRSMPIETLEMAGIFYIENMAEMLLPKYLKMVEDFGVISPNNHKPIFSDRYIIPILNQDGKVQNLVGYSPDADERYIYGKARYYQRRDTMYGLENIGLAYKLGIGVLVEGITDVLRLRSEGIKNVFANCGTHSSDVIIRQLNRCRHGVIIIPDRDSAGMNAVKGWKFNRSITIITSVSYKDIDEMLGDCKNGENVDLFKHYFDACVKELGKLEHQGNTFSNIIYTIL